MERFNGENERSNTHQASGDGVGSCFPGWGELQVSFYATSNFVPRLRTVTVTVKAEW